MKHDEYKLQRDIVKALREWGFPVFAVRNERNEGLADANRSASLGRVKGAPDLIAGIFDMSVWIELKTKTGKQSPEQKCFQQIAPKFGAVYMVIRSVDELWRCICELEEIGYGYTD